MPPLDRTRDLTQRRHGTGADGASRAHPGGRSSRPVRRSARIALALSACVLAAPVGAAAQAPDPGASPAVPAPSQAPSPFAKDRLSSKPAALTPDSLANPFRYPDEAVVLTWGDVPGAVGYQVEVSSNPGFSGIVWEAETVQPIAVPDALLPDGDYWWRVKAVDQAGTVGVASDVARFAKTWPNQITGTRLAAVPGGGAVSHVFLNPYMTWAAVPGAATYDVELAMASQFGAPVFTGTGLRQPFASPASIGSLPDATYQWRVRARDPKGNPGPWTTASTFTKGWVAPTVTGPADGATTHSLFLTWEPVEGAQQYQVQISNLANNFSGEALKVNATTSATGFSPTLAEQAAKSLGYGNVYWRVRPVIDGVYGAWSAQRQINWAAPGATTPEAVLSSTGDSDSGLSPRLTWTPVTGASLYRIDVATDPQFTNIVESQLTTSTGWSSRNPLPDNQLGAGYHWRVVWGSGITEENPNWMVDEASAPTGTFRKQTRVVLGAAGGGPLVSEPPLLTWGHVPGIARYELQLSPDGRFDESTSRQAAVYGLGAVPGSMANGDKRLPDGTWSWRVRAVDGGGKGQTWSPVGTFTLTSPRPDMKAPADGAAVVFAPLVRWGAVAGACGYQVQVSRDPSFKDGDTEDLLKTAQTALVPPKGVVTTPGRHYWRVRADYCDEITGQWSPTRSFRSVFPPSFNLNSIPQRVNFKRSVIVAGQLRHSGAAVRNARILLQRRVWPADQFRPAGTIRTDRAGRFRFRLRMLRSASYRLVWEASPTNPEGTAAFGVQVQPQVTFRVAAPRVVRKRALLVRGSIYPRRPALIQIRTADGWRTVRRLKPNRPRFAVRLATHRLEPGRHRLRLWVPRDPQRKFANASSRIRPVFVYDRFVIRSGRR